MKKLNRTGTGPTAADRAFVQTSGQLDRPGRPGSAALTAVTGSHCPRTGLWEAAAEEMSVRRIHEGELLPSLSGRPVVWRMKVADGIRDRGISYTAGARSL